MAGSSHFKVPNTSSDANDFLPNTKLPDHLAIYSELAKNLRKQMTSELRLALELTDKIALRSASLPQTQ